MARRRHRSSAQVTQSAHRADPHQWAAPDDGGSGGGGDGEEAGEEAGAAVNSSSSSSSSGGGGWRRRRQRRRRRECGQHYDLLRVARNASRDGVLREAPVRGHPFVLRALRRRLRTVMGVVLRACEHF